MGIFKDELPKTNATKLEDINQKLEFVNDNGQDEKLWSIIQKDYLQASVDYRYLIKNTRLDGTRDYDRAINNLMDRVDDLNTAVGYFALPNKYTDPFSSTQWKVDFAYSNSYLLDYFRRHKNPPLDAIFEKILVTTEEEFAKMWEDLLQRKEVGFDIETSGLDPRTCFLVGASFAYYEDVNGKKRAVGYYIPVGHGNRLEELFKKDLQSDMFSKPMPVRPVQLTEKHILSMVQELINRNILLIVHNAPFDLKWMIYMGVQIPEEYIFDDTLLMVKCLDERLRAGLKETMLRMFNYVMIKFEEVAKGRDFDSVNLAEAMDYAATDPIATRLIWKKLKNMMLETEAWRVYENIERPAVIPLIEMELSGCSVNLEYFKALSGKLNTHTKLIKIKIKEMLGGCSDSDVNNMAETINNWQTNLEDPDSEMDLNSSQQVSDLLYNRLGLAVKKTTDKGNPSSGKKALGLMKNDHPIIPLLQDYRLAQKLLDAYVGKVDARTGQLVGGVTEFINHRTNKVHTQTRQMGARSSRMSQTKPSLQVLPRNSEFDIRAGFVADPGCVIGEADYCQMELMMAAALSQDEVMLEAFSNHRKMMILLLSGVPKDDPRIVELKFKADLHTLSTAGALGIAPKDVTDKLRTEIGKILNFLILYGGQSKGLADLLTLNSGELVTEEYAQGLIDGYFNLYKGLSKWLKEQQVETKKYGIAVHACGRRVHNPFFTDWVGKGAIRTLVNSLIQGECASRFKIALAKTYWEFKNELGSQVQLINTVHDALYTQMPQVKDVMEKYLEIQRRCMEFEFRGVYFSVETQLKKSMSKKDKVKIPGLIVV